MVCLDVCRAAIAQRRMPFNISVVSDFMKDRERFWKEDYPDVPFAQIARTFMDEVRALQAVVRTSFVCVSIDPVQQIWRVAKPVPAT